MSTWFNLTGELFSSFLIYGHTKDNFATPIAMPQIPTVVSPPEPSDLEFSKDIKRDVTQYNEFTDDSKWIVWQWNLKSLAATHGIENILSSTYVTSSAADKELFKQQQNFTNSIFEHCLKTSKFMKFVCEYHSNTNFWTFQ